MKREIKWYTDTIEILDISYRERIGDDGQIIEYAVIKIPTEDDFDTFRPWQRKRNFKRKKITLMCFKKDIYKRFKVGEEFKFEGILSFGYGSTYLKITMAFQYIDAGKSEAESIDESNEVIIV